MTHWIMALLDETPIKPADDSKKSISPPPAYVFTANDKVNLPPPTPQRGATPRARGRPRGSTPARSTPGPKASSPSKRKPKTPKAPSAAEVKAEAQEQAKEASESLQNALNTAATAADKTLGKSPKKSAAPSSHKASAKKGSPTADGETATIEVDSAVEVNGNVETTTTNVRFHLPGGQEIPHPENPEEMIEQAKKVVEEARKLEGESSTTTKSKRKADTLDDGDDDDDDDAAAGDQNQPAKRQRLLEQKLKTERVRNRTLAAAGFVATVGYVLTLEFLRGPRSLTMGRGLAMWLM